MVTSPSCVITRKVVALRSPDALTDDVIELKLAEIRDKQIRNGVKSEEAMIIPHPKTINRERNRRLKLRRFYES
jgi:hypothetical protein